ncbi:MAG: hypothetical protein GY854_27920 [Deltaproteobacteria bacterium]|nr:hypothetical protein [Deltaproteobacteria bacterium]
MIGRPESEGTQYKAGADPIEKLFDQLRQRRLAKRDVLIADAESQSQEPLGSPLLFV